jgi:YebC/PmpR family DNA-binding regulatory protein
MSGHSKWATIKRKKAGIDAARGKVFTKAIKEITIAARTGGGDPAGNPRLRTAIAAAKAVNMPADNIERAIKKGTGQLEGVNYEEIVYEGYAPHGVALMIESTTDNRNRTTGELRHILSKYGGNLAEPGAVGWNFQQKGIITLDAARIDEDTAMTVALEAGAEDFRNDGDTYEVSTAMTEFHTVREALEAKGMPVVEASIQRIPNTTVELGEKEAASVLKVLELVEDNDDVQKVFANFDIPDEVMAKLEA